MSGIIDSKTRVLDSVITPEGRAQLAKGGLRAAYYSFTDGGAIYTEDTLVPYSASLSGSSDVAQTGPGMSDGTYRIMLEAVGLPQDQITFEADDSGRLVGFPVSGSERYIIRAGQIFSGSNDFQRVQVTGSAFNSLAGVLLSGSIDAFKNQLILKSPDPIDEKIREFTIGTKEYAFNITNDMPFKKGEISRAAINQIESLFHDKRLSHIPNFKFLPPVNKSRVGTEERTPLGNYANLSQAPIQTKEELDKELSGFGFIDVNFTETSNENNLLCQFFESSNGALKKLDVIDFGTFNAPEDNMGQHVFFVGKVFIDGLDQPTFVNMFTLIFEN